MNCGNNIKVKFFEIHNNDGNLFAKIEVVAPKKVLYGDKLIDLTKLNEFSQKQEFGIFVGREQISNRDSLFCATNKNKVWTNGHIGYFNLFNTLLSNQDKEIRKLLDIDVNWDAEWSEEDIVDNMNEEDIKNMIHKNKEDKKENKRLRNLDEKFPTKIIKIFKEIKLDIPKKFINTQQHLEKLKKARTINMWKVKLPSGKFEEEKMTLFDSMEDIEHNVHQYNGIMFKSNNLSIVISSTYITIYVDRGNKYSEKEITQIAANIEN